MDASIAQKVGKRVREIRITKKMTQEFLAKQIRMERSFVSHIENGTRNISLETLEKILHGLGITFKKFFNTEEFK